MRDRALEVIDSGADLRRWQDAEPRVQARRAAALARVQEQLTGPQPARKVIRRPARHVTTLEPGDIVAFQASSGRIHLLAIRAVAENRYGAFPLVRLLDFHQESPPLASQLAKIGDQPAGRRTAPGRPAEPWWKVDGQVQHRRGHDFVDCGFEVIGQVPAPPEIEQARLGSSVSSYSGWRFWQGYLTTQDELLGQRLASDR